MLTATDNTGQTSRYTYDADGNRTRRQIASSQEEWQIYGMDGELVAEYRASSAANAPEKEYGYRNGQLLITATGRFNVALAANGAVATASSTATSSGFSTTFAINGNYRGPWGNSVEGWNDNTPNVVPDWIQVDFAGSKTIDEISVFSLHDNYTVENTPTETQTFTLYGLLAFDVQYWNGSSWTTIPGGSVTGNNKVWRKFTFSPITTSKIRVTINAVPDAWSRVVEIQAFGTSAGGEKVQWLVADHLGTPRIVLDQTGSLATIKRHDYLPFGEELFAGSGGRTVAQGYAADGVRQQFTSKERDIETNLDWFGLGRYYSSWQGRFTSVDPLRASAKSGDPQSWNRYTYALNRATVAVDPNGLSTIVVTVNPRSAGGNGHATIQVFDRNGNDVVVRNGSNRVDARAIGQGQNRAQVNNDTPFGVYRILPNHRGSNANGTDGGVAGVAARPQQTEFGTGIVTMEPVSGEVADNNRTYIYIHGGGRDANGGLTLTLDTEQPLTATQGCVRAYNVDVNALISTINTLATNGDSITNIFIGDNPSLNAQADERDTNGNYLYPELRNAGFGTPDAPGRPTGNAQP